MDNEEVLKGYYQSPIGPIELAVKGRYLISVKLGVKTPQRIPGPTPFIKKIFRQLEEYFQGQRRDFDIPLSYEESSDFKRGVWEELRKVSFGETASYGQVAKRLGIPGGGRAVGTACKANNLMLFVPCHRILGADGRLTGFAAGIWRKEWLLKHEKTATFKKK